MKKQIVLFILFIVLSLNAQNEPIAYWSFDEMQNDQVIDLSSGLVDSIFGNYWLVEGVKGKAIKCDGYTTRIFREADDSPLINGAFTIEAWIAPQAYPWNWCAIVNQEFNKQRGFFFGIDAEGRVGLHLAINRQWREFISDIKIPFMKWSYVAATFDPKSGVKLFIDGELANEFNVTGVLTSDINIDLQIAKNHEKTVPSSLNRAGRVRVPASYSIDGIIDEIKIFPTALTEDDIREGYNEIDYDRPDLTWRRLPSLEKNHNTFGAYYTELFYDKAWNSLWKDAEHTDIVVTFDDENYFMNFWKGTNYNLNLVTENDIWIGDQSAEGWSDEFGCAEHMSDKQNRYSHVRLIENSSARAVVHWRYALTDIVYNIINTDPASGWGDWVDEYYYIYPDGIAVRHFIIHGEGDEYSITEPAIFSNPGEKPEDNVELAAVTLANLHGDQKTYSFDEWPTTGEPGADFIDPIDNPVLSIVNTRSIYKPFYVYEEGTRIIPYGGGRKEIDYSYSHFHARNHWPVSQIPCDGRFVLANDRVTSSAITSPAPPMTRNNEEDLEGRFLVGITEKEIDELIPLAKAWLNSPSVVELIGCRVRFDRNQRAYIVDKLSSELSFTINSSSESPIQNLSIVVNNWNSPNSAKIESDTKLNSIVQSVERDENGRLRLLAWINIATNEPINLEIR